MEIKTARIDGIVEFVPTPHLDERGLFSRTFDVDVARAAGVEPHSFVQDSLSRSHAGVVRGLHIRLGRGESKLVRCSSGAIFDVVVDLRRGSATYGEWVSFELSGDAQSSVFVPAGFAHGFQALTEPADTSYRIDRPHDPAEALSIAYDDPALGIPWPLPVSMVSQADRDARQLSELAHLLPR